MLNFRFIIWCKTFWEFNLFRDGNYLRKTRRMGGRKIKFYLLGGRSDGFKGGCKTHVCTDMEIQMSQSILLLGDVWTCVNILPLGKPGYSTDIHEEDLQSPLSFFTRTVGGKPGCYNTVTCTNSIWQSKPFWNLWSSTHALLTSYSSAPEKTHQLRRPRAARYRYCY